MERERENRRENMTVLVGLLEETLGKWEREREY
jgi:hypothetical protein